TITSVYGVRPHPGAPVSAPVTWAEIEATPPRFHIKSIWTRLEQVGDLFRPILSLHQDLRTATGAIRALL
ncbi:MAG: DNA polymerase, partial [Bacillota bacterium]